MTDYEQLLDQLAKGISYRESVEEYQRTDAGKLVLVKRRDTIRTALPDFQALKYILERDKGENDFSHWTEEQLKAEKIRLLKQLAEENSATESGV